jgi:hypothetical protein
MKESSPDNPGGMKESSPDNPGGMGESSPVRKCRGQMDFSQFSHEVTTESSSGRQPWKLGQRFQRNSAGGTAGRSMMWHE